MSIPEVDISNRERSIVVQQIHEAFSTVGFAFITSHNIPKELVKRAFAEARALFCLPLETKLKCGLTPDSKNNGYITLEQESIDPSQPGDLKECFNICSIEDCPFPKESLPSLKPTVRELFLLCKQLAHNLLEIMGHGLQLKDPQYFVKAHMNMERGAQHTYTTMRFLHYPPLPPEKDIKPGQLRCGEHVDYGSITLLFQDPNGGLQVKQSNGDYIDVHYHPDAVLVNLGALMQKWTSDVYLATPHRVLLPTEKEKKLCSRQSLALFVHPDNEVVVKCVDGSNKYAPITAEKDTLERLNRTYNY